MFPASDCLCAVYARKHPVSPGSAPETVVMVDVGRLQTTVVVARFGEAADGDGGGEGEGSKSDTTKIDKSAAAVACPYSVLAVRSDEDLGAFHFDRRMFRHFQAAVSGLQVRPPPFLCPRTCVCVECREMSLAVVLVSCLATFTCFGAADHRNLLSCVGSKSVKGGFCDCSRKARPIGRRCLGREHLP